MKKPKGKVINRSSKVLWVIEGDSSKSGFVAHKLLPGTRSRDNIDVDGFKRFDETPIKSHIGWWKIRNETNVRDFGKNDLKFDSFLPEKITDKRWENVKYDPSNTWGIPLRRIASVKKDKKGVIKKYLIEEYGWVSKSKAIKLASNGLIDGVFVVKPKGRKSFLKSTPDKDGSNNLSSMG